MRRSKSSMLWQVIYNSTLAFTPAYTGPPYQPEARDSQVFEHAHDAGACTALQCMA